QETHTGRVCVAGAARPDEALALAAATRPQVVLVGLSGPVVAALALIAELRQSGAQHVVAMSQLGSAGYAQAALAAGATAFVDKDRLQIDLVPVLNDLMACRVQTREA
ncbi:hypothetical protein SE17_35890, partial [Kouleothrix aurantiaca]